MRRLPVIVVTCEVVSVARELGSRNRRVGCMPDTRTWPSRGRPCGSAASGMRQYFRPSQRGCRHIVRQLHALCTHLTGSLFIPYVHAVSDAGRPGTFGHVPPRSSCRVFPCATPAEVRAMLPANTDVVVFQCRNPVHRAHYELFTRALHAPNVRPGSVCLVHPTCGPTQVCSRSMGHTGTTCQASTPCCRSPTVCDPQHYSASHVRHMQESSQPARGLPAPHGVIHCFMRHPPDLLLWRRTTTFRALSATTRTRCSRQRCRTLPSSGHTCRTACTWRARARRSSIC